MFVSPRLTTPLLAVLLMALLQGGCQDVKPGRQPEAPSDTVGDAELVERWTLETVDSGGTGTLPPETLQQVADLQARAVWGMEAVRGEPIQLVDARGRPRSYAFPYALEDAEIPGTAELLVQSRYAAAVERDPGEWAGRYGTVYVSADKTHFPITQVLHALHPYYRNAERALAKAGDGSRLLRLVSLPPHEFFEIGIGGSTLRLHAELLLEDREVFAAEASGAGASGSGPTGAGPEAGDVDAIRADRARRVAAAWQAFLPAPGPQPPPPPPMVEFRIRRWQRMPAIDWTHWCEPTAAAMVFSFWDHYVPVPGIGTHVGYDRIVDYWFDNPFNGWNHNTPDIIEPIASGINVDAANVLKGYNWSVTKVIGTSSNDYAWPELTAHLHLNRPFVWQVHPDAADPDPQVGGPHATAAFGYRIVNGQRFVILYSTWSADPILALKEWTYDDWAQVEVDRYVPGGKELYRYLFIRHPMGGETFHVGEWNEIRFAVHPQTDITKARIEYSLDGGQSWQLVVEVWTHPDWNSWWWRPPTASDRARIRVRGMNDAGDYLGGDGSFENFRIE